MQIGYRIRVLALLFVGVAVVMAACAGSSGGGQTDATAGDDDEAGPTSTTLPPSENPIEIVFNGEISGPLVYDTAMVKKGVRTALQMLGYRAAEWSIDYKEVDNQSDALVAVEQTRQAVLTDVDGDRKKDRDAVDFICGPLSSANLAAVTYFIAQRTDVAEKVPQCAVTAQPSENITTSGGIGLIPSGLYRAYGSYLGRFASETLHFETANCIHYSDRIAEEIQTGFESAFIAGGGTVSSVTYVPAGTIDFTSYFAALQPADCTLFWVRGGGAIPFVRQHAASGLGGTLLVPQSSNYSESQLEYLAALGMRLDLVGCDIYTPLLENPMNRAFISTFQSLYPGEQPTAEALGGWQAVMLYAEAVKTLSVQNKDKVTERGAGLGSSEKVLVDPRNPAHVIATMGKLTIDTPSGSLSMSRYGKTYLPTRDFYILRSRDVGSGRIAWVPIYTYSQVRMAQ